MARTGWKPRLRYAFDTSMAAGPVALIGWLAVLSLLVILIAGSILALFRIAPDGGEQLGLIDAMWAALMRSMDAGAMGGDTGWGFRIVALLVTIAGIFIFSSLIGILTSGIEGRLGELRKGRSRVLETDHTVILNWSPSVFDIIAELTIANMSRKRPRIVIMAVHDKVAMEDEIAAKVPDLRNTRIICRSGDPTDLYDLGLVSPDAARSIIVLSPEIADPDSAVIKTVLALVHAPGRRPLPYRIAAEIREARNAEIARVVGGAEVQLVLADELIARIVVQSARQAGLSEVYQELLDFSGCEIYAVAQPDLAGNSFGDALMAYESSTLIGLVDEAGAVSLNPPLDTVITTGMRAIILAEDDAAIRIETRNIRVDAEAIGPLVIHEKRAERTLLLGWNRRAPIIVRELSRYVAPGSELVIAADTPDIEAAIQRLDIVGDRLAISFGRVDTTSKSMLEGLDVPAFDHVLVLGYSDQLAPQPTDTNTLVTLLHLRGIADAAGRPLSIVSEMIDVRNRELAEVTRADDFVVSNKLVSLMLAQASENDRLAAIFDDLLDEAGSEFQMRSIGDYVSFDEPVTFYTLTEAARRRGEVAIGYARRAGPSRGVVVNPKKTEAVRFSLGDRLVVLARD